jgi:hypothetical protein
MKPPTYNGPKLAPVAVPKNRHQRRAAAKEAVPRTHKGFRLEGRKGLTTPQQDALAAAALFIVYNIECERFDKTVCTGVPCADGSGRMPLNTTELGITSEFAAHLAANLLTRAERFGLTREELEAGDAFVQRMPYEKVVADYAQALRVIGGALDN